VKPRTGNRSTNTAPRGAYRTRDGHWVCLSASIQKMAERLFRAIGRPELIEDPRYATNAGRVLHAEELDAIIGAFIAERTQAENVAYFEREEVTIGPPRPRARADRRLSRSRHGRISHAPRRAAVLGHAGRDPRAGARAGRA
jgi:crotonobetainyl-CoA:carnitine CoA-transferase CaiB-like acyl-CoA transferase